MRVLLVGRHDLATLPAGDTVQVTMTLSALKRLGVAANLLGGRVPGDGGCAAALDGQDLVHVFGVSRAQEAWHQVRTARDRGIPVVVSPIYWDMTEFLMHEDIRDRDRVMEWWRRDEALRREVIEWSSAALPNSKAEEALVRERFDPRCKVRVVYNAADPSFVSDSPDPHGPPSNVCLGLREARETDVLCVARISPRKNQLALIRALQGSALGVVLAGAVNDPYYFRQCVNACDGGTARFRFTGHLSRRAVRDLCLQAKVHVMPSWFETPGLASLEAGLAGCRIVSTDRGSAREYFEGFAWYCDPASPESIGEAIARALESRDDRAGLVEYLRSRFSWDNAASETLRVYEEVVRDRVGASSSGGSSA